MNAAIAQIDNEITQARELRGYLEDRRDRTVNLINLTSIAAGGTFGVVSSPFRLSHELARVDNVTGVVSGTVTAMLSARSGRFLHVAALGSRPS